MDHLLVKAVIKQHSRKTASGKVVNVKQHVDSRKEAADQGFGGIRNKLGANFTERAKRGQFEVPEPKRGNFTSNQYKVGSKVQYDDGSIWIVEDAYLDNGYPKYALKDPSGKKSGIFAREMDITAVKKSFFGMLLNKALVKQHQRRAKSGKMTVVRQHTDSRSKKAEVKPTGDQMLQGIGMYVAEQMALDVAQGRSAEQAAKKQRALFIHGGMPAAMVDWVIESAMEIVIASAKPKMTVIKPEPAELRTAAEEKKFKEETLDDDPWDKRDKPEKKWFEKPRKAPETHKPAAVPTRKEDVILEWDVSHSGSKEYVVTNLELSGAGIRQTGDGTDHDRGLRTYHMTENAKKKIEDKWGIKAEYVGKGSNRYDVITKPRIPFDQIEKALDAFPLMKSIVKQHARKLASGKIVTVKEHTDSRTKAPEKTWGGQTAAQIVQYAIGAASHLLDKNPNQPTSLKDFATKYAKQYNTKEPRNQAVYEALNSMGTKIIKYSPQQGGRWHITEAPKKGKADFRIYHESFTSAANEARDLAERNGYTINEDDWFREVATGGSTGRGRPAGGKSNRFNIGLDKDGKPTKHALAFQVYGMESGKYELNAYLAKSMGSDSLDLSKYPALAKSLGL